MMRIRTTRKVKGSKDNLKGVLLHEDKRYYYTSQSKRSAHYVCSNSPYCRGRALKCIATGVVTVTKAHTCLVLVSDSM